ncbi:hypothetical protein SODALDRAFT_325096 [Sodiomyces alkalinus F11]|uniref:Uncharacterized protein n=1 Tax=Sodiomyces alkalinus (strain CBS 110278 / VKM F-3762 / F11) TaxID=1314773 RepID=A0A3N2PSV9_SODAK|nr:hypothetical protein SODALDRAFT_325096 [Sodiomyces alkalinus F11]ROT37504.1 hypothetical protein SODALDRAFT_325096 [Sodiomyces alkalinus F11]
MDGSYQNPYIRANSPLSPNLPAADTSVYRANINRTKTRKWVEAKAPNYDGDDWGGDDFGDDFGDEPAPMPVAPLRVGGPYQPPPALPSSVSASASAPASASSPALPSSQQPTEPLPRRQIPVEQQKMDSVFASGTESQSTDNRVEPPVSVASHNGARDPTAQLNEPQADPYDPVNEARESPHQTEHQVAGRLLQALVQILVRLLKSPMFRQTAPPTE